MRSLSDFLGFWTIEREIEDLRAQSRARLTGTCAFSQDPSGSGDATGDVLQREQGQLDMAGMAQPLNAERQYIWRQDADSRQIAVHFEDGRFFHAFDPNLAQPQAGHDCAPDRYDVRYDFSNWRETQPYFCARWQVSGPRKDYISETKFTFKSEL